MMTKKFKLLIGIIFILILNIGIFSLFPNISLATFFIEVVLLGLGIVYLTTSSIKKNIETSQERSKTDLMQFKTIVEAMKDATNLMDYNAPYKKIVEHASDAILASPVRSSLEVESVEDALLYTIAALKISIKQKDETSIVELCKEIERMVADRNSRLKLTKR